MQSLFRWHRLLSILILGFASGLPLALTGQAMQAWLTTSGMDIASIGFLGLVGLPYAFKFLWAPLMDRFEPPFFGRRRGWLVCTQLLLALALFTMAGLHPVQDATLFQVTAVLVAFFSASQDIVIDAYRSDLLPAKERGLGASLSVMGYRLGMVISGGIAFIWADNWDSWGKVYLTMSISLLIIASISWILIPRISVFSLPNHQAKASQELKGFVAMLIGVVAGIYIAKYLLLGVGLRPEENQWIRLLFVMVQIAIALPLGLYFAKRAGFLTLIESLKNYFDQKSALKFLLLIVLYKLGDAFAGTLFTPFLLQAMQFSQAEVGLVNKLLGLWLTIIGGLIGGVLMLRLGLLRALLLFGILQIISNLGFYGLSLLDKGVWGGIYIPPFDWGFLNLPEGAMLDFLLLSVIAIENISGGMGTTAFVAFLMALCHSRFSATQFALLSALAVIGRIYVSPIAGVLVTSIGWSPFFLFTIFVGLPSLWLLWNMRTEILELDHKALAN
jgi:PAT family beta-lactamase induction signal transducer AmpG